jgi:1,4-dihydroxy-2-naphthoate octaprenyltransferase
MGVYFVQTAAYNPSVVIAAIPSGILVHNLLLLNEFPDIDADKKAGRKTLPITMGLRKASIVYSALTIAIYLWIVGIAVTEKEPFILLALLMLPFAIKAIQGALKSQETGRLMPAMGNNVMVVLLTQLLMGIGYILAGTF